MTKPEFINWLNEMEKIFPVIDWRVDSLRVWPLIRLQLFGLNFEASIIKESLSGGLYNNFRTVSASIANWLWAFCKDWRNNVPPDKAADVVFLTGSYGGQPTIRGKRYNPLLAPYIELVEKLGKKSLVWEMCPHIHYNIPRYTPSFFIQPYLLYLRISRAWAPTAGVSKTVSLEGYSDFVRLALDKGLRLRYRDLEALVRDVHFVLDLANRFKLWLKKIRPTHGFIMDHWLREHAFCLACRELDIVTIEIQHGVQDRLHPAYASWKAVPPEGYETLARVYWCWDEESVRTVHDWASATRGCFALLGGEPWREMWKSESELVIEFDSRILDYKRRYPAKNHILLSLDSVGPLIPTVVLEALRSSPEEWCYWVRLHPVDYKARVRKVRKLLKLHQIKHMDVEYISELPLHSLLRHVDLHVTVSWSSIITQAQDFGVPSVACGSRAKDIYPDEILNGTLKVATRADEIMSAIRHQLENRVPIKPGQLRDSEGVMRRVLAMSQSVGDIDQSEISGNLASLQS